MNLRLQDINTYDLMAQPHRRIGKNLLINLKMMTSIK